VPGTVENLGASSKVPDCVDSFVAIQERYMLCVSSTDVMTKILLILRLFFDTGRCAET